MTTERLARTFSSVVLAGALLTVTQAPYAAEAPEPPVAAQATYQVTQLRGLPSRLPAEPPSPVRSLDPAIFIELSPVTASEPAVRLPEDQQDPD